MTDDQKKLAAIIEAKFQDVTAQLRYEIEKEFDEGHDEDTVDAMETFYDMDNQFDKLVKRYGKAIAMKSNAVVVGNLIDLITETNS